MRLSSLLAVVLLVWVAVGASEAQGAGGGRVGPLLRFGDESRFLRGPEAVRLFLDEKGKGSLTGRYEVDRLQVWGSVQLPLGLYRVALAIPSKNPAGIDPPVLRVGDARIEGWEVGPPLRGGKASLQAADPVVAGGKVALELRWPGSAFFVPPLRAVVLTTVTPAVELSPTEAPPLDAPGVIVVEAEDLYRAGSGVGTVSRDEHADDHGGASLGNFAPGQWVEWGVEVVPARRGLLARTASAEWRIEVTAAARYALFARTATQAPFALCGLDIDRQPPFPGAALLRLPGTGGQAGDDAGPWTWTALAGADDRPPLDLAPGRHRLRITAMREGPMNVDVLVLVPVP